MHSSIFAFVAVGMLLALVQCDDQQSVAEYEIKQNLLGGRSYSITSKTNAKSAFTVSYDPFHIGKTLNLFEDGKLRYIVHHEVSHIMSTWKVTDEHDNEKGILENSLELIGSEINGHGSFGNFRIKGRFRNRDFTIRKDGQLVARIEKKAWHLRDTYGLSVYGDADQALMVLFTIVVDEIRKH